MATVSIRGAHLTYEEKGEGDPLVFVHGSLEDYRSWRLQMEPFARSYRVITYSRRYHYPNLWTGGGMDYSVALHAEDLAALLTTLDLAPAHLVCSSFGGYVALYMAAQRPELARSLVLGEPPLLPWLPSIPGGEPLLAAFMEAAWEPAQEAFRQNKLYEGACLFLNGVIGADACDRLPGPSRQMVQDNAPEMRAEALAPDCFSRFTPQDAARVDCPTLLLKGERSPKMFHLIIDELARRLPNKTKTVIPAASHAMHLGNAAAYNSTVLNFLARQ